MDGWINQSMDQSVDALIDQLIDCQTTNVFKNKTGRRITKNFIMLHKNHDFYHE